VAAIAAPIKVGGIITSVYTLLVEWMIVNLYGIGLALWLAFLLKRHNPTSVVISTWNKRTTLLNSIFGIYFAIKERKWNSRRLYVGFFVLQLVLVAQLALSIIFPTFIQLGSAAPVNPKRVVILGAPGDESSDQVRQFQLKVPGALRAGSIARVAPEKLREKVKVPRPETLGQTEDGEDILRINYGYTVYGTDMGLQNASSLRLEVTGACTTEYG
jgi:hypothetical protein